MFKRSIAPLVAVLALAATAPLQAASISLQPSQATVGPTQEFNVDVLISAADAPGSHPGLYKGSVIIDFDPALVDFEELTLGTGVGLYQALAEGSSGGRTTLTFGFFDAPETGSVASLRFTTLGAPGAVATFGIADSNQSVGSFFSTVPTNQRFYPSFTGTSVSIVPLPGTAWLALGAFGLLAGRLRRRVTASR